MSLECFICKNRASTRSFWVRFCSRGSRTQTRFRQVNFKRKFLRHGKCLIKWTDVWYPCFKLADSLNKCFKLTDGRNPCLLGSNREVGKRSLRWVYQHSSWRTRPSPLRSEGRIQILHRFGNWGFIRSDLCIWDH